MEVLTSNEVNSMIFHYLTESGFTHSAFPFRYEARVDANLVPPRANLIRFVQKGMNLIEMEAMADDVDNVVDEDFFLLQPMEFIRYNVDQLRQIFKDRKKKREATTTGGEDNKGKGEKNMASIHAAELNYMVFRHLSEFGYIHTAFNFGYEAQINKSPIDGDLVPNEALVKFVQKGIQHVEMEAMPDDVEDEDISLLKPSEILRHNVDELHQIFNERMKNLQAMTGDKRLGGGASTRVQDKGKGKQTQRGNDKDTCCDEELKSRNNWGKKRMRSQRKKREKLAAEVHN